MNWTQLFYPFTKGIVRVHAKTALFIPALLAGRCLQAQQRLELTDLSSFRQPSANWTITGDVKADLSANDVFSVSDGTGILVNQLHKTKEPVDLYTNFQHGDLDLELDYMMARGANSGIYLQGRYEVQLLDSWGVIHPRASDNGGIYERWDDSRPQGQQGYEGHAPRQNASRAPGLWQHLKISFQAPRFDAMGKRIQPAKILLIALNGVTIQDNVELSGVTRGAADQAETSSGPLRLQGDHGAVAFRNIVLTDYSRKLPELSAVQYSLVKGKFGKGADLGRLSPFLTGKETLISTGIAGMPQNEFGILYKGSLHVKEAGEYTFRINSAGGSTTLRLNGQPVIESGKGGGRISLGAGDQAFELSYLKYEADAKPGLGITVTAPGMREYALNDPASTPVEDRDDPILIPANENTVLRSFMDLKGSIAPHAVSVGSPAKVHYTYDLDHGMLAQVWRGDFLDATPMWHDRGDGMSIPLGAVQGFGKPVLAMERLATPQSEWSADTAGTGYRPKGYALDKSGRPGFRYIIYGTAVEDVTKVTEDGHGVRREITVKDPVANLYVRLAEANKIEALPNGLYLVDDKSYYIKMEDAGAVSPLIREMNGRKELIIPIQTKLTYSILF
jgi:hypothetical protein